MPIKLITKRLAITLLIGMYFFYTVQAADHALIDTTSPRAAMAAYLHILESNKNDHEISAIPFLQNNRSMLEAINLAEGLRNILKKKEIHIDLTKIPTDKDYIDPVSNMHIYYISKDLNKLYLVKVKDNWAYGEPTVKYIEDFYQRNYIFSKRFLLSDIFEKLFKNLFHEVEVWQIACIIIMFLGGIIFYYVLKFLLRKPARFFASKEGYEGVNSLVHLFNIFVVGIIFKGCIISLKLPLQLEAKFLRYIHGGMFFALVLFFYHLVDWIVFHIHKQTLEKKRNFNLVFLPMAKVSSKIIILIVGTIITLQGIGLNVKGLVTGVGLGGLGFALASQDTIKNFFGSLVIFIDKPFVIGDYIVSDNQKLYGKVEEIGFRSTRLRTDEDILVYVPNGKLADNSINNYGEKQYKYFSTQIAIPYNTPTSIIEIFIEGLRKIVKHCPAAREDRERIYLYDLKKSTFYIKFEVNFNITDPDIELKNRQDILLKITKLMGILDIHLGEARKQKNESATWEIGYDTLKERVDGFFNK